MVFLEPLSAKPGGGLLGGAYSSPISVLLPLCPPNPVSCFSASGQIPPGVSQSKSKVLVLPGLFCSKPKHLQRTN